MILINDYLNNSIIFHKISADLQILNLKSKMAKHKNELVKKYAKIEIIEGQIDKKGECLVCTKALGKPYKPYALKNGKNFSMM